MTRSIGPAPIADQALIRSALQRVATGPHLSKNLSADEARAVMHALLADTIDPVQAAIFLIALRMKRETNDEMTGILDALLDCCDAAVATVADVVVLADPGNGFNRYLQASLGILPVLAACGIAVYATGVETAGPKYGVTHHLTLRALGGNPLRSTQQVAACLADPDIGWGYLDQARFCAPLQQLNALRTRIVKRPVLSTLEVTLGPISGARATHLVTGFVHKPYPPIYTMLARHAGYQSGLIIRGTEGGVVPSFRSRGRLVRYWQQSADETQEFAPADVGLGRDYQAAAIPEDLPRAQPNPQFPGQKYHSQSLAAACAEAVKHALDGQPGPARDSAVLGAALIIQHLGVAATLAEAVERAEAAIDSGDAARRFRAGL